MTDYKNIEQRFKILMMGAIDNELDARERAEFEELLQKHPEFTKEFKEFQHLKEATSTMKLKTPPPETWDTYWVDIYNRIERGFGWILLSIGGMILLTWGGYQFFRALMQDTGLPAIIKIGILSVIGGLAVLLVSVVRERLYLYKTDPYKEIKR